LEKKLLSRSTYRELKELLDLLAEINELHLAINEHEQRITAINGAQERIRQNLGALQNSGEEGKLRGQYVQQLAGTETELADIAQKIEQLNRTIQQKEGTVARVIAKVN
jgi:chromosome segregation ATPase